MNERIAAFPKALSLLTISWLAISSAQITETKLTASDGGTGDELGYAVSMSGDYALVGAWGNDGATGSAYIFQYDGLNWVEQTKLLASDGATNDVFGISVSILGDYAIVGAEGDDNSNGYNAGAAYIFHYDGSNWEEQTKLIASDGIIAGFFGRSVSLSGEYALVGAFQDDDNGVGAGSAYVFHYDGSNWIEQAKLIASDGTSGDYFGSSVSLSGENALIGAHLDNDNGINGGSAYIFHYDGSSWVEQVKLIASDGTFGNQFGCSVSLSGDYAMVGAYGSNSAYAFHFDGLNWLDKPISRDGITIGHFGYSVSVAGEYAIVGAILDDDNGTDAGSVYLFRFDGSSWERQAKIFSSDGSEEDYFGTSVFLSGNNALVGAPLDDDNGTISGSAYVYSGFSFTGADPLAPYGATYGSTGSAEPTNPGALITIDPLTGAGTLIGPTGIIGDTGPSVPAIAIRSTGEIYAVSASTSSGLYTLNASTGAGIFVADMGLSFPSAMTFDQIDNLFVVDGTDNLYTVDETNGAASRIGPLGFNARGIAFDPTDGVLYGSSGADEIYTIDPETGSSTLVGYTGLGGATPDIHFDQQGNLFGTKLGANTMYDLVAIDKRTGAGTIIGPIGFTAVIGLSARLSAFPTQVELASPPAGEVIAADSAVFLWHASGPLVDRYWFELSEDSLFSNPTIDSTITDSATTRDNLDTGNYWWRVKGHNVAGWGTFSEAWSFSVVITEVEDEVTSHGEFSLSQNHPNPFNPSTAIRLSIPKSGEVSLRIFNVLGEEVAALISGPRDAGTQSVTWDAAGQPSGVYFYRLQAGEFTQTRKLVLLR